MKMKLSQKLSLLALIPLVASCGGEGGKQSDYATAEDHNYSLTIKNLMGNAIEGVKVELSAPGCKTVNGVTDKEGKVTLVGNSKEYNINVKDAPYSYFLDPKLTKSTTVLPDEEMEVKLSSTIIDAMPPKNKTYELGDLMFDTCGLDGNGEEVYLSDLMEGKKAVMINFWYETCSACMYEFPFLTNAYDDFMDDVSIMALDPFDDEGSIAMFKKNNAIKFDMLFDADSVYQKFSVDGYPTSVIIDRYGFITFYARGAFGSEYEVRQTLSAFTSDDYVPQIQTEESLREKPDIPFPNSDDIKAVVGKEGFNGNFYGEEGVDKDWSWPWVIDEKEQCLVPANSHKQQSFATFYTDINIQANQVFLFDYYCSTEAEADILYILVDGMILFQIHGEHNKWQTLYAYIPQLAGEHTLAFLYLKDSTRDGGQDTIKLKNFKITSVDNIDQPTYIYRGCAFGEPAPGAKEWQHYEPVVLSDKDHYYHVGTADGPLVLCNFLGTTNWDPNNTVSLRIYEDEFRFKDVDYTNLLIQYDNYSANNSYKLTPVTEELKNALNDGFNRISGNDNPNEWLEACYYYFACGKGATQIASPIHGLATFDCDEAKIGDNSVLFDYAPVLPRGKMMKFVAPQTGVFKFEGNNGGNETDAWLGDANNRQIGESDKMVRHYYTHPENMDYELYHYLEAGKTYYITSAFYDVLSTGRLRFKISYVGDGVDVLKLCSPGYEIGTTGPDGELDGGSYVVQQNVKLADDGYYHSVNRDGSLGDYIYAEFKYLTEAINFSILTAIDRGYFKLGNDDRTEEARSYAAKMITTGDKEGLVPVDKGLHDLLVDLMDYYEAGPGRQTWQRLCYYSYHIGK